MKAMLLNSYGENAAFETAEVAKPEVKAGHVLVKIAASSVNTVDTMIRSMGKDFKREKHAEILRKLAQIVESSGLKPVLDEKRFSLEEVGQAHARLESGQAIGKVVVENIMPS